MIIWRVRPVRCGIRRRPTWRPKGCILRRQLRQLHPPTLGGGSASMVTVCDSDCGDSDLSDSDRDGSDSDRSLPAHPSRSDGPRPAARRGSPPGSGPPGSSESRNCSRATLRAARRAAGESATAPFVAELLRTRHSQSHHGRWSWMVTDAGHGWSRTLVMDGHGRWSWTPSRIWSCAITVTNSLRD
jgi:hypothetical protein